MTIETSEGEKNKTLCIQQSVLNKQCCRIQFLKDQQLIKSLDIKTDGMLQRITELITNDTDKVRGMNLHLSDPNDVSYL